MRILIALALVLITGPSWAQETARQLDLVFPVQDLRFVVTNMGSGTANVAGEAQTLAGSVKNLSVNETNTEIHIELAADVLFDFDKANIRPSAQEALKQAATIIRPHVTRAVVIAGHTDAKGNDDYNQKLSQARANAVRDWFVTREGLTRVRFVVEGFGSKRPVAPNTKPDGSDDPEGRQKNRRVEITITK